MNQTQFDRVIVELFLSVASNQIFQMRDLWKKSDWASLEEQAERFKLSCDTVGAFEVAEACVNIRRAAVQAPEELKTLIQDLFISYSRAETALSEGLDHPKSF